MGKNLISEPGKNFIKVSPSKLHWQCDDIFFNFTSTADVPPLDTIVGQSRAIEAIKLGAGLNSKGYNIFVSGLSGTGRLTTVKRILEEITSENPEAYDYCYVNNFSNPDNPRLIKLQKGRGKIFSDILNDSIRFLRRRLPVLFEEAPIQEARKKIMDEYQKKEEDVLHTFDETIQPHGFVRGQIESEKGGVQPEVFPVIDGKPVQIELLENFVKEEKITEKSADELRNLYIKFHNELFELARKGMKIMQEFKLALANNDKNYAEMVVDSLFDAIKEQFKDDKITLHVDEIKKYILGNLNLFLKINQPSGKNSEADIVDVDSDKFNIFSVNIILDNSQLEKPPIVIETSPTYTNLFGTIERVFDQRGFWRSDFSKIKAGSILKADRGYLIVNGLDLFTEPGVWNALKRVLLYDKLEIQPYDNYMQMSQSHLKPEPVPVNVKVVIIGGQSLYRMLYFNEKGFKKIFKVNAQFDYETERTDTLMNDYARFISKICRDENLPHCSPSGVAAIIEWAVKKGGSQNRITLKFSDVADILRESAFYDRDSNHNFINREDVEKAIACRRRRNDLIDEKLKEQILEGNMLIDTSGRRVGQVNGLTVLDNGMMSFGKPARITATISAGTSGIINVEREAELSGSIHNKAVLIISGFMRERFAQKHPLSLTASIAFEQSYGGIDGDSASAAEIYAVLSALSNVPINQSLAITGSVNQKGDIQPIGGVNEKIRGYFEICCERGLTGKQGVIIPEQNIKDLMLYQDIISEVEKEMFHIYAISNIEQGAELLMDFPVGKINKDGKYPSNSLFGKVVKRLKELHESASEIDGKKKNKKKKNKIKNI